MNAIARTAAALALALICSTALPAAQAAATPPTSAGPSAGDFTWAVQPSGPKGPTGRDYFVYTASPGHKIQDYVAISNLGRRTLSFRVYATDAFNTVDGSFALLTADRRATGVGSWAAFKSGTYTVKAGKRIHVPFSLSVPANATPGDHSGGVIAAATEQQTNAQGQRVNVDRRVAARIYLRVNGPVAPALQLDSLRAGYSAPALGNGAMKVTYRVRNTGNVRVTATARLTASGPFGWSLGRPVSRPIPELLPGNSYTFTERLRGITPAGPLTAAVKLIPADPGTGAPIPVRPVTRTTSAWATPWLPLTAVFLALAAILYVLRRRRTRPGNPS